MDEESIEDLVALEAQLRSQVTCLNARRFAVNEEIARRQKQNEEEWYLK